MKPLDWVSHWPTTVGHTPRRGHATEGSRALIPQTKGRSQSAPGPRRGAEATDPAWRACGDACEAGFSHRGQLGLQWWTTGPNVRFPPVSGRDSRVGVRSAASQNLTFTLPKGVEPPATDDAAGAACPVGSQGRSPRSLCHIPDGGSRRAPRAVNLDPSVTKIDMEATPAHINQRLGFSTDNVRSDPKRPKAGDDVSVRVLILRTPQEVRFSQSVPQIVDFEIAGLVFLLFFADIGRLLRQSARPLAFLEPRVEVWNGRCERNLDRTPSVQ